MEKSMNIRNVSEETKTRFDILNAQEQHRTQAETLTFLLDNYDKTV